MPSIYPKQLCKLLILVCLSFQTANLFAQSVDSCNMPALPTIHFKASVFLSSEAKRALDTAATIINSHQACNIMVAGNNESCELCQQIAWDRTYSVITYLEQKGVSKTRLIFSWDTKGPPRDVSLIATTDTGPNPVPAPVPCYSFHKLTPHRCADLPTDGHIKPKL